MSDNTKTTPAPDAVTAALDKASKYLANTSLPGEPVVLAIARARAEHAGMVKALEAADRLLEHYHCVNRFDVADLSAYRAARGVVA